MPSFGGEDTAILRMQQREGFFGFKNKTKLDINLGDALNASVINGHYFISASNGIKP